MSLSEPETGSDLASIACRAVKENDGWRITGNKYWCTFADGADYILLFARTQSEIVSDKKHLGISAFLIDKKRGELPENVKGSPIPKIGYFGWKTYELAFDGLLLPSNALIGEEGKALKSKSGWEYKGEPYGNGTDDFEWNGLPGGRRFDSGQFKFISTHCYLWSSSEKSKRNANLYILHFDHENLQRSSGSKQNGLSVRCLRD